MAEPLAKYARAAPTPVQREIALVAHARGFQQEGLAKALKRQRVHSGIAGRNVMAFFATKRPHSKTVDDYLTLLGMSERHVRLCCGELLTNDESLSLLNGPIGADIRAFVYPHVCNREDADALLRCDDDGRIIRAASAYALEREREEHGIRESETVGGIMLPKRIVVFLRLLHPDVSLDDLFRRSPIAGALAALQAAGRPYFEPQSLDAIIVVARSLLIARGVDPAPLDAHLRVEQAEWEVVLSAAREREAQTTKSATPKQRKK